MGGKSAQSFPSFGGSNPAGGIAPPGSPLRGVYGGPPTVVPPGVNPQGGIAPPGSPLGGIAPGANPGAPPPGGATNPLSALIQAMMRRFLPQQPMPGSAVPGMRVTDPGPTMQATLGGVGPGGTVTG